jgi:hemolysin activation/secretion protein
LRSSYARDRIKRSIRTPLNIKRLEAGLQLLQADPLIKTIQAELKPGSRLSKSVLTLNLKEANFLNGSYSVENRDSPSTGEWRHTLSFVNQNLTTNGDRLSIDLAFTAGAQNYSFDWRCCMKGENGKFYLCSSLAPAMKTSPKTTYRVRNWKEYDAALKQRGSITF